VTTQTVLRAAGAGDVAVVEVAVAAAIDTTLHYAVPDGLVEGAQVGRRVLVPLGPRQVQGVVVGTGGGVPEGVKRLRPLAGLLDEDALVTPEILALCRWAAGYYLVPLGEMLRAAVPRLTALPRRTQVTLLRALSGDEERGMSRSPRRQRLVRALSAGPRFLDELRVEDRAVRALITELESRGLVAVQEVTGHPEDDDDAATASAVALTVPPPLNPHQQTAVEAIAGALDGAAYRAFLVEGVTGSGKTEVYLGAIAHALARGRQALVLVPEIALTPQLVSRFQARFGAEVAVLHSALSLTDRASAWRRLRRGAARIGLGTRSAVFAPIAGLGIVVVDEEHDGSFKQADSPRYHARDLALVRAQRAGAVAVLGSATPSLESIQNVERGLLSHLSLPERATSRPLPEVELVDLRRGKGFRLDQGLFSPLLVSAISQALSRGEQSILFLNRRGFSPLALCQLCGQDLRCKHCSVALTFHRAARAGGAARPRLVCHHCGFQMTPPARCPACHQGEIELLGLGTEQVEERVREAFPQARVLRLDRDTASPAELPRALELIRSRQVDIVVGTQMLAKGHDFPEVTVVGIVLADQGLSLPDFRAAERTFQLLVQVAGRAGRGELPGKVIVQTFRPTHPAIVAARAHDVRAFYAGELAERREVGLPPFRYLVLVRLDGGVAERVEAASRALARRAAELCRGGASVLGPAEAPLGRLRGMSRWQFLLRGPDRAALKALARELLDPPPRGGVRVSVDVDPLTLL
jgi:primosomal protein N' (replication factor Y)